MALAIGTQLNAATGYVLAVVFVATLIRSTLGFGEALVAVPLLAGTTSYPLMVFFGSGIDPATFTAELNGVGIASLFTPTPGGMNVVNIPVSSGRNVLLLQARGIDGSRMPRDADRFVLKVP
ncbi:MAG: hypothetical protein ACJ79S_04310 [Gemmatimonadaceae bacterium]